jgi:N-acetylmuramoyl-L-alanine amidase
MAIIVIDPGHGGAAKVGGSSPNNASSPSGLLEKNLTLAVARHALAALTGRGHTVTLTRDADVNLGLTARAQMARAAAADAFVSIHFNGFADETVQGTETWVHLSAAAASLDLAACVQRAMLRVTRHRDRGVQAKQLGVLDPAAHHRGTAACLAEVSFITTNDEDRRLQDATYLRDLGGAVAGGIEEFVARLARVAVPRTAGVTAPVSRARRQARGLAAARAAGVLNVTNPKVANVPAAIAALPGDGRDTKFAGKIKEAGGNFTHLQGLAGYKGVYFLTQSDENENAGRLLVADRATRTLLHELRLPVVSTNPRYFHAGGCQVIGDILVIPSEAQDNKSIVCFFDVSDPLNVVEIPELRVFNDIRDAAAVGITNVTRDGREVWILAVFDSGTVDVYQSLDLAGRVPFTKIFSDKVSEKHHQAMPLVTDTTNRVCALGLNRTFLGDDVVAVYAIDFAAGTVTLFPDPSKSDFEFKTHEGGSLRWGAAVEIVSDSAVVMHCTSKHYTNGCHVNVFDPAPSRQRGLKKASASRRVKRASGRPSPEARLARESRPASRPAPVKKKRPRPR